ncbi:MULTISPECIES: hypothetical protein [unclassified Anabaena]|uniref:hypothetical protein n=1 Tax=unclassified Anabaena TaxID=2619674 RepID=UPI000831F6E1|nr:MULTISPECIES: hypothetical protein [unclassified Anabaena]
MVIDCNKSYPKRLILCLGVLCGAAAAVISQPVYSQQSNNVPALRILRVTSTGGTTFKLKDNWFLQSSEIKENNKKCAVRAGDKFFVASINDNRNSNTQYREGNSLKSLTDYYTVTFDKTLACNQQNQTWYIFKKHVQQLQAVPMR